MSEIEQLLLYARLAGHAYDSNPAAQLGELGYVALAPYPLVGSEYVSMPGPWQAQYTKYGLSFQNAAVETYTRVGLVMGDSTKPSASVAVRDNGFAADVNIPDVDLKGKISVQDGVAKLEIGVPFRAWFLPGEARRSSTVSW